MSGTRPIGPNAGRGRLAPRSAELLLAVLRAFARAREYLPEAWRQFDAS